MISRTLIGGVAVLVLAASVAVAVEARKVPPPGPFKVTFSGCPIMHDVEGGCLTIKKNGTTYELNSIKTQFNPAKHLGIMGTGIWYPESGSTCMMGKPLVKIKWQYTRLKCPSR